MITKIMNELIKNEKDKIAYKEMYVETSLDTIHELKHALLNETNVEFMKHAIRRINEEIAIYEKLQIEIQMLKNNIKKYEKIIEKNVDKQNEM